MNFVRFLAFPQGKVMPSYQLAQTFMLKMKSSAKTYMYELFPSDKILLSKSLTS